MRMHYGLLHWLLIAAIPAVTHAQLQQVKPLRLVIGFPPGGPIDTAARLLAPPMAEALDQPVVVDNRAGANGIVGTDIVAKAPPDGHTLLLGTTGNFAINPALYPKLPFNILRDFAPVSHLVSTSSLIYVHPALPVNTLREFIAHAAANPGKLNYSSSGTGSIPHLAGELLNAAAKIKTVHVPYKGTAPAFNALLANEAQFAVSAVITGLQHVKTGRLRAIATTTRKRIALLPDLPAANETLPGYEVDNWYGVVVPAHTLPAVIARLHKVLLRVATLPAMQEKFSSQGLDLIGSSPAEFDAFLKAELTKWARVVKSADIRPE